jgi:hypothetical protein
MSNSNLRSSDTVASATQSTTVPIVGSVQQKHSLQVIMSAGTLTYSVQITLDGTNWLDVSGQTGLTAATNFVLDQPIAGARLDVTAWTSGDVTLSVLSL